MKTFKQFNEELPEPVTPKQFDVFKSDLRFIRTPDTVSYTHLTLPTKA